MLKKSTKDKTHKKLINQSYRYISLKEERYISQRTKKNIQKEQKRRENIENMWLRNEITTTLEGNL